MKFFSDTKIDFIGKRKIAFAISIIIILAGIASLVINKGPKYSIDFSGGVSLELDITPLDSSVQALGVEEIRNALAQDGITDVEIQEISDRQGKKDLVLIKTKLTETEGIKNSDLVKNQSELISQAMQIARTAFLFGCRKKLDPELAKN